MKQPLLIGGKIRRLRKRAELSQVELASRLGISPSYLNLIEHNRRALTRAVSLNLGKVLRIEPQVLSGGEEGRLLSALSEVFGDPLFMDKPVSLDALTRLVGAAPEVAAAIPSLYRAYREAQEDALSVSEHLADNPFLEATSHRLLTLLTSIRSFSEILRDNADLAAERRQLYIGTVASESEKLTDLANELFGFFSGDAVGRQRRGDSPAAAVGEYLESKANYFAELEDAAGEIRRGLRAEGPGLDSVLAGRLAKDHGISIEIVPSAAPDAEAGEHGVAYDEERRRLCLSEILPQSGRGFAIARQVALAAAGPLLDSLAARAGLESPAATDMLRGALGKYLAAAILMPYGEFLTAARDLRHDIEILRRRFAVSFEQACHRLTTLQRPGAEGVPFHFLRVDMAGNITKRLSGSGLRIPRFGGTCPRWNAHRAFIHPGRIDTQLARFPDGETYVFLARAQSQPGHGYHAPQRHTVVSIGCDVSFAGALVYTDGLGLQDEGSITPVGLHCRQCARRECSDRAFPSFLH